MITLPSQTLESPVMQLFALFLLIVGAIFLVVGFRKNHRVMLTCAAVLWLASGALEEFANGFIDGLAQNSRAVQSSTPR
jgi:hypothetical protein